MKPTTSNALARGLHEPIVDAKRKPDQLSQDGDLYDMRIIAIHLPTFFSCTLYVFFLLINSCATAPETDRRQLMLVPSSQMNALGAEAYEELLQKYPEVKNQPINDVVQAISDRLIKAADQDYEWEVKVFQSDEVNAFCLPGGKIGVFSGILKVAKTNAGLAAILGHEIAHATARHGAERLSQALLTQGAMIAANITLADKEYRNLILGALGIGMQVGVMLPYSRKHEAEADHIGTIYMAEAGYNPEAAVEVWQTMAEQGGGTPPELLSTHPAPESRIEALREDMSEYKRLWRRSDTQYETKPLPAVTASEAVSE